MRSFTPSTRRSAPQTSDRRVATATQCSWTPLPPSRVFGQMPSVRENPSPSPPLRPAPGSWPKRTRSRPAWPLHTTESRGNEMAGEYAKAVAGGGGEARGRGSDECRWKTSLSHD